MLLHTLLVDPDTSGKGYGTAFVDYYEKYALEHNCPYLRMDTNERNSGARKLYKNHNIRKCDILLRAHIEHGKNGRGYIEKSSQYNLFHFQKNSVLY